MSTGERVRTVLVDDDPDARYLIARALTRSGRFEVVGEAVDGRDAIAVCESLLPDLVLLDLYMPGDDGLTVLPQVRAVCPDHSVIVVISGDTSPAVAERAAREGATAFVAKDPGFRHLVEDLLGLVDGGILRGESDQQAAHWHLPADLSSGRTARRQLRHLLAGWQLPALLDEAELLATELINNAVVHAGSDVLVSVQLRRGALRIAVSDAGVGTPLRPHAGPEAEHGRGLMMVEALATDWGVATHGDNKTVWFDLAVP